MLFYLATANTSVIQIGVTESLIGIGATILAIGIAWGTLRTKVNNIDKDVEAIKKDTRSFAVDIASIKTIVSREYQSEYASQHSPRQLTPKGNKVLVGSGIKEVIDGNKDELLKLSIDKEPKTAYDAENCVLETVTEFIKTNEPLLNSVKEKTFALGETIDIVTFVGGIYFRDYALPKMGFNVVDVDKK